MKLTLDETQRLNLHLMLGNQRGTVNEIRAFWKLQDLIALSDKDKERIEFKTIQNNGNTTTSWNSTLVKPLEFKFNEDELAHITKMFREWQHGFSAFDRIWLEPLLAQLDNLEATKEKGK